MADSTLELLIKLGVVGKEDVRAANDLIAETRKTTEVGGDATKELGSKAEAAAEKVKLFRGEANEMRKVIHEVTQISPALGMALKFAMNPIAGTVAAGIGAFVLLKEHIKEVERELDAMGEKAAEPTFLEGIRAKLEILRTASVAAQEYASKLVSVTEGEKSVTAELTTQLALQTTIADARSAQASAEEALATAKIKAEVASGKITPEMGVVMSAEVKRQAIADQAKAKQAAQDQELASKNEAADALFADLPGGQEQAAQMQERVAAESARRAKTAKDFGDGSNYPAAQKEALALKDKADAALFANPVYQDYDRHRGEPEAERAWASYGQDSPIGKLKMESEAAQGQLTLLHRGRQQFQADQKSEPEFNARKIAADDAQKIAAAQDKLASEIEKLNATIAATRSMDDATAKIRQETVTVEEVSELKRPMQKNSEVGAALQAHPDAEHQAAAITQLDASQAAGRALASAVAGSNRELAAVFLTALDDVRRSNADLMQQIINSRNRTGG